MVSISEQMTIGLGRSVSRWEKPTIGCRLSSFSCGQALGGRYHHLLAERVTIVGHKSRSKSARSRVELGSTALRLQPRKPQHYLVCAESRKRWPAHRCCSSLAAGPSSAGENPVPSSSDEEGAPMRKSSFTARLQRAVRQIISFFQNFSPDNLLKAIRQIFQQERRRMLLSGIIGCAMWLIYIGSTASGKASPQVVPYSNLVDHLQSRTVTSALFEDGSNHVFFNVVEHKSDSPASEAGSPGRSDGSNELTVSTPSSSVLVEESIREPTTEKDGDTSVSSKGSAPRTAQRKGVSGKWEYSTRRVKNDEAFLLPLMRDAGVTFSSAPQSVGTSMRAVLITVITLWIPLSPLLWLLHRQMSQSSSSAKKKRKVIREVKFADVAGVDVAKTELMEIVDCMKGAAKFTSLGAKVPKGVLLVGPPGTGKTLLARAVAGEAKVPFFAASASEFVEMFVGRGAARIRELFSEARKRTPSIVFIDELDAVGGRRGRSFNDERDQTLNQLLTEMDGFESDSGILVLAATNRPEALDPALYRPGRLSRRVHFEKPDILGRQQVLALHMRGVSMGKDPVLIQRLVASLTNGFVGADLANLVNEAALLAARKGRSAVILDDFKEAIDRVKYGVRDNRRGVFNLDQKLSSWLSSLAPDVVYPALPSGG